MTGYDDDLRWMRSALALARRGDGRTGSNPAVGCVLVKAGAVIGRGATGSGGRPHAETCAIASAGSATEGATAYVTLEPCAHHGKTPPCCEALIKAGVSRVVVGLKDPDERVSGKGIARLKEAGIAVETGIMAGETERQLAGYLMHRRQGRPHVSVKLATSMDGRIGLANGESRWITGALARRYVHLLRSRHDAVLTGMGTVRKDNPLLTCRIEGIAHQPWRLVMASQASTLPEESQLARSVADSPVTVLTAGGDAAPRGIETVSLPADEKGRPAPGHAASHLAAQGITSLLIEAGGLLVASWLKAGLVDRIIWIASPSIIGGDGIVAIGALGFDQLEKAKGFHRVDEFMLGDDRACILERTQESTNRA